jgi:hypothetical protein
VEIPEPRSAGQRQNMRQVRGQHAEHGFHGISTSSRESRQDRARGRAIRTAPAYLDGRVVAGAV